MQQVTDLVHVFTQAKKAKPANQDYETKNLSWTTATREMSLMVRAISKQKNSSISRVFSYSFVIFAVQLCPSSLDSSTFTEGDEFQ